ncbi:MAG: hypothetical protein ACYSUX_04035 [Planctomycetota bacterium]|jgi:hypothetical protein
MRQITSAIISSCFRDLTSRRGIIVLIGIAAAAIVLIVGLLMLLPGRSSPSDVPKATLSALSATDEIGSKWTLELVKGQPLSLISKSNKKPGPPLLVKTNVRKISNSRYSIGITVEGQAGEKYIGGAVKNGKREPEPQFVIVDEKTRILAKGKFEYG